MEEAEEIIEAIEKEEETIIRESSSDEILDMNKSETESKEEKDNFNL